MKRKWNELSEDEKATFRRESVMRMAKMTKGEITEDVLKAETRGIERIINAFLVLKTPEAKGNLTRKLNLMSACISRIKTDY